MRVDSTVEMKTRPYKWCGNEQRKWDGGLWLKTRLGSRRSLVSRLISNRTVKTELRKCQIERLEEEVGNQRWQGSLVTTRLQDEKLSDSGCFWWLTEWKSCPTHTIASMFELYEQLLPTRLYACQKTHTSLESEAWCRLCGKTPESVAHILSGCGALAQSKYLSRHDSALKVLFYEMLHDGGLIDEVPPWYSPAKPKPVYESDDVQTY